MSGNLLHINKTYNRIRKRDVIDTPKTENSVRTIDIPNFLKEEVQEYAKMHYGFLEDQRLFPIVARTLQKRLKKYEELTGVKPIRVHDIRHSHVAYLIYQGVYMLLKINVIALGIAILVAVFVYFALVIWAGGLTKDEILNMPKGATLVRVLQKIRLI